MKVHTTKIPDVLVIEPQVFGDDRGFFLESWNQKSLKDHAGIDEIFVQDNHSKSSKGVLRGLHYQDPPYAQGKLIRIVAGEVFDVAVDIRKGSPTYGQWLSETLSEGNKKQLWIPEGFAHGFLTLSGEAEFLYKTTNFYSKEHERTIHWKRNDFGIIWPDVTGEIITSNKDAKPS